MAGLIRFTRIVHCELCTEEVYEDQMDRHLAKDHEEEEYAKHLEMASKIVHEYGIKWDVLVSIVEPF